MTPGRRQGRDRNGTGAATPLIALDAVALDTETTGLDVRRDRIVQIGALRMHGAEIDVAGVLDMILDPGAPIPEIATRVHGLSDADVAGRPGFAEAASDLTAFIGEAVVIGHSIAFDLAMLRHEAARCGVRWTEPRSLDVALLAAGLDPELVDTSLDNLALWLGVEIEGRHSALGDARAAAEIYAALIPRLLARGIRTLGEAETLCRKASNMIDRQEQAGWHARPSDRPDYAAAGLRRGGSRAVDSFLYRQRLADVMSSPPISIPASASLHEAAALMDSRGIGCLIVENEGAPPGILTERDVLRIFAERGAEAGAAPVAEVMSAPVISAPDDTFLYRALGLMARRNLRYIGVTGADGRLEGVFTLRTLLRERALATLSVGDEIAGASDARDLARAQAALPGLAAGLLADGLDARAVTAIISAEGRAMTARAGELAEAELADAGRGPAPADYALLVLGSGGRGESMLAPDQDNALVIADGYEGELDDPDDWFVRFAARVNEILDQAGIPYCKGGVMARNRPWRRRLSEWEAAIEGWARDPTPEALLNVDIFYDFAPVLASSAEGAALAQTLRRRAAEIAGRSLNLLRAIGEVAGARGSPLGFFGRIRKDDSGRVDLKAGGLLPVVSAARVVALRYGVTARTTPDRLLRAAERAGRGGSDAETFAEIHGFLMRLVLTQQVADIEAGVKPTNRIDLAPLGRQDRDHLRDALGRIDGVGDMLHDLLQGVETHPV